jgi:hypothetical protein
LSVFGQTAKHVDVIAYNVAISRILRASIEVGLYVVVLGRPTNSIWNDSHFRVLLRRGRLQFSHLAFCRFGAPYWKMTKSRPTCRTAHSLTYNAVVVENTSGFKGEFFSRTLAVDRRVGCGSTPLPTSCRHHSAGASRRSLLALPWQWLAPSG